MKLADQVVEREQPGRRGAEAPQRRAHRRSRVPNLVGQPAVAAIDRLRATGPNPAVEHQPTDAADQHGLVLAQEPSAEAEVARGATLAVWIGVPIADDAPAASSEGPGDEPEGTTATAVDDSLD